MFRDIVTRTAGKSTIERFQLGVVSR